MRIALPQRVPVGKTFVFAAVLVLVELVEGTHLVYSALVFCYVMLSAFAFNVAGGFTRPSGAYIFYYAMLAGGVGTVYKALLGQAADTHLLAPVLTMSVYAATTGIMLCAAFLARRIVNTRDGMAGILNVPKLSFGASALGCVVMVFAINNAYLVFGGGIAAGLLHAIAVVNYFLPLSILLSTVAAVQQSGGRHSTSPLTLAVLGYSTYAGLLSFSKQGMFSPFLCWILGLAWSRFELRTRHVVVIAVFGVLAQFWMVPLANVGREEQLTGSPDEKLSIVEKYVAHPLLLRENNRERQGAYLESLWYYGTPQGIFDRFTMLPNDSQLISFTADGNYFGYLPIIAYYENWVPHVISPHKLEGVWVGGNRYAHELGQLADEDLTTGISFSPSAEAFHIDGWRCLLLVEPLILLLLFISTDFVCGDLRAQPWGLLPLLVFAHLAPEQLLGGTIFYTFNGNVGMTFAIIVCGYVAPVFGRLLKGRERTTLWQADIGIPAVTRVEAA